MARREPDRGSEGLRSRPLARGLTAAAAAIAALVLYATFVEPQRVGLEEVEVRLDGLPPGLEGFRILQVSDLESHGWGRREVAVRDIAAAARADILVVTGDLVAKPLRGAARQRAIHDVAELLGGVPRRLGAWFVEGHGERPPWGGRREMIEALEARGVRYLEDEVETVTGAGAPLAVAGLGLRASGRRPIFFQRADGSIVETGASRADGYFHLDLPAGRLLRNYEFAGEFRFSREDSGIGVTFHNRMPLREDRFYRLRRTETGGVMNLSPHGTVFSRGKSSSGVSPGPGPWVAFRVRVEDAAEESRVRARIWLADDAEPDVWQIDCTDATPTRPGEGSLGLWTSGPGRKEFRRLAARGLDGTPLVADGKAAGAGGAAWRAPVAPDWMLAVNARIPEGAFPIVLSHTPDPYPAAAALGWPLLLAGHTQGGQVRLPFFGAISTDTSLGRRYAAGLFDREGSKLYITRGVGTSRVPFRFLSPPEVTLLVLRRETARPAAKGASR